MAKRLSFDDFWVLALKGKQSRNTPSYHPCCDTWSTRFSSSKHTHKDSWSWKKIMLTLDRSIGDQKQALKIKMIEAAMQIPILLNQQCSKMSSTILGSKIGSKDENTKVSPPTLETQLDSEDFNTQRLNPPHNADESNIFYHHKISTT